MTRKCSAPLVWAAVIALLLGAAYVIVDRNGGATPGAASPAAYSH